MTRFLLAAAISTVFMTACGQSAAPADAAAQVPGEAGNVDVAAAVSENAAPVADIANEEIALDAMAEAGDGAVAAGSWQYGTEGSGDDTMTYAQIEGRVDGAAPIVLRFHSSPNGGRQARMSGFAVQPECATGCRLQLSVDGGQPQTIRATVPQTPQPQLSMRDARQIWRSLDGASELTITYPGADGEHSAQFDVSGIDLDRLPRWK